MITAFKILCLQTGMSATEIGAVINRSKSAVDDYWRGKGKTPDGAFEIVLSIVEHINNWAKLTHNTVSYIAMNNKTVLAPNEIEIGISSDDYEAQGEGFPTRSAENMAVGRVLAMLPPDLLPRIKLVPRGSTPATAAAEKAHN